MARKGQKNRETANRNKEAGRRKKIEKVGWMSKGVEMLDFKEMIS